MSIYDPPFAASMGLQTAFASPTKHSAHFSYSLSRTIKACEHNISIALAQNIIPSTRLADYALNECVDLTASPPMESFDPFGEPALDFEGTGNAQGNVHRPCC